MSLPQHYLDTGVPPAYITGDLRRFYEGEVHLTRTAGFDVLIVMLSGELIFYEGDRRISLRRGEWYIQRAGYTQEGREPSLCPEYYYIHFTGGYTRNGETGLPLRGEIEPGEVAGLLEKLVRTDRSQGGSLIDRLSLFYSVLSRLRERGRSADNIYGAAALIEEYIRENYTRELTLRQLSGVFGYTADHIIRLFRKKLGITPHQYVAQLRYDHARRLLLTTGLSLERIAEEAGYLDVSTLYRIFVRNTGVSPSEWRRQQLHGGAGASARLK